LHDNVPVQNPGCWLMTDWNAGVRNVSDTALWVAYFRAIETQRSDALFRDPFAERLAGKRGFHLANTLPQGNTHEWAWMARTYLFDMFVSRVVKDGADLVLNLAAGLDARPYRMDLPSTLQWVEVDFPEIVSYKEEILAGDHPKCRLERVALDLAQVAERRELFASLNGRAKKIAVMSEGLLIYFVKEDVSALAQDLASGANFHDWIIDLASPGQLKLMQRSTGKQLSEANAAFKFGPPEGVDFFKPLGWEPKDVQSMLKTAAQFKRAPDELLALLPEPKRIGPNFPWTGVCLLQKT
jgi:methyltransferase (TIGR00027 family)